MRAESAGIVLYRRAGAQLEVLLVHPGGPFWRAKDAGAWTIPKGEIQPGEEALAAAIRELREETGVAVDGPFIALGPISQKAGKRVTAFACEGDCDAAAIVSNTFSMEWPPRSGRTQEYPEVDRAEWFTVEAAREKINAAQFALLEELQSRLR
jgi:predicted NUDIX family NTP pyrophosphohydrolase